jgi:hypothetical protein
MKPVSWGSGGSAHPPDLLAAWRGLPMSGLCAIGTPPDGIPRRRCAPLGSGTSLDGPDGPRGPLLPACRPVGPRFDGSTVRPTHPIRAMSSIVTPCTRLDAECSGHVLVWHRVGMALESENTPISGLFSPFLRISIDFHAAPGTIRVKKRPALG